MDEDVCISMTRAYLDGEISATQRIELGEERPEIGKFLEFVKKYEGVPFRAISDFGGLEFCFDYQDEFEKFGISGQALARCMDADAEAIRTTCRVILASMQASREQEVLGATHLVGRGLAISPAAVKAFILATLDAKEACGNDVVIPELYFLLSQALFPGQTDVDLARSKNDLRHKCGVLSSAHYLKYGKYPSYRDLSKALHVAPSTISRAFETPEELQALAELFSSVVSDTNASASLKNMDPSI